VTDQANEPFWKPWSAGGVSPEERASPDEKYLRDIIEFFWKIPFEFDDIVESFRIVE